MLNIGELKNMYEKNENISIDNNINSNQTKVSKFSEDKLKFLEKINKNINKKENEDNINLNNQTVFKLSEDKLKFLNNKNISPEQSKINDISLFKSNKVNEISENINKNINKKEDDDNINLNNQTVSKLSEDKLKFLNEKKMTQEDKNETEEIIEEKKPIITNEIILEQKEDMNIYEYNNPCIYNGKAILFLGNAQIPFIQTFINYYLNVSYDDNFRFSFKINDNNSQKKRKLFNI